MVVVGGSTDDSDATGALEIYDTETEKWVLRKDLRMSQPRHSFCAVPGNLYTNTFVIKIKSTIIFELASVSVYN